MSCFDLKRWLRLGFFFCGCTAVGLRQVSLGDGEKEKKLVGGARRARQGDQCFRSYPSWRL